MPIPVLCPQCRAKFRVSDKFAGKQGPCPKCKATITVPIPEEVKIHVPEEFESGGKDAKGRLITKPIARQETKIGTVGAVAMAGGVLTVLLVAWIAGEMFRASAALTGLGLLIVSPPLVLAGYAVLRDEEREPYRGRSLWIRAGICSLVYAGLWGAFAFVPPGVFENGWNWLFLAPPFLLAGSVAAFACLDLDLTNSFFHYAFYALATMLLRTAAGWPAVWNITG